MPDPARIPACEPPTGYVLAPAPTQEGAMIVSVWDEGQQMFVYVTITPPEFANDQILKYGTNGPYWANVAAANEGKKA